MGSNRAGISVNVISESAFTVRGHGVHSAFVDTVQALKRLPDIDLVVNSPRRADIVHLHTVGPMSAAALAYSSHSVVTAHITADSLSGSVLGGRKLRPAWRRYLASFYNRADATISLSRAHEAELRRDGVLGRIVMVSPGVAHADLLSRTRSRRLLGIGEKETVVLSVGQVQPRKAVHDFHRVAAAMPDVRFIWVGGFPFGPLTAEYRQMRSLVKNCANNVTHTGQVPRPAVRMYYAAADVYFHPSHQEHAPVAVFEAAAAKLPLVLRDLETYRQLFPGLYMPSTEGSFVAHLRRLLADGQLFRTMGGHAEAIGATYSSHRSAIELADVYRSLVG